MYTAYNFGWKSFPNTPISSLSWPIYLHTHWCTMPPQWSAPHRIVPTVELAAHGLSGDGNQSARRQTIVVHCDYDNILSRYYTKLEHFVFGTFEVQRFHPLEMPPPTRHRVSLPHWRSLVEVAGPTPPVAASATSPMPQVRSTWQLNQTIFEVNWKEIGIIKILRASC